MRQKKALVKTSLIDLVIVAHISAPCTDDIFYEYKL